MTTTSSNNRRIERAAEAAVPLTDQERKLVSQIDEQRRQARRWNFITRLISTPLIGF